MRILTAFAIAATLAVAVPAAGPGTLSPERLQRIDRLFQQYVDEGRIAGAVGYVLQDGKPVYERAFGWADKEAGVKMAPNTIFRIASQTKAITSVAVLSLMEEGKLTLTDPVSRYIPTFAATKVSVRSGETAEIVPARRQINIRDLLTHTAGISYGTDARIAAMYEAKGLGPAAGFGWFTADKDEPICVTMERLGTLPFVSQPGEAWVYGYNTDVLGCIVEKVSGMPLDQFIKTRITDPLKMNDTQFFLPAAQRARLAAVYMSDSDGKVKRAPDGPRGQGAYVDGPRKSFAGGAGLLSTAQDYAHFLEMIRRGGAIDGIRILSPRTVELMTTNQVGTLHSQTGLGWGLGFETTDRFGANGLDSAGAFGWAGAYSSTYRVDPESHLVICFMVLMLPNTTDLGRKFPTLVYQALEP
jgi:CubicO group peptidase (beta-lactamase class C family)